MSQVSKYPIQKDVYNEIFNTFLETIAGLITKEQVSSFFDEFLTPTEKIMFAKRLAVGILIAEKYDYTEIKNLLKVSSATIAAFSTYYKYGENYRRIIDKIRADKRIKNFLIKLGEFVANLNSFGGKGAGAWREVAKSLKSKRSKILQ